VKFRYTPRFKRELRERDKWWRENRPAAPNLFIEELIAAIEQAVTAPLSAKRYFDASDDNVRYIPMSKTQCGLYYTVFEGDVVLLAVWGGRRRRGPKL
jgi:ParE toxin of type II toxin-antitoxin system, parDE